MESIRDRDPGAVLVEEVADAAGDGREAASNGEEDLRGGGFGGGEV